MKTPQQTDNCFFCWLTLKYFLLWFLLFSDCYRITLQGWKLKKHSFHMTVVWDVLSGNFSVFRFHSLWNICVLRLWRKFIQSNLMQFDQLIPEQAAGLLLTLATVSVPLPAQINEGCKCIGFIHSADVWYICPLLSLGESYNTNRSCFLNDLHHLLKGYDGETCLISNPANKNQD